MRMRCTVAELCMKKRWLADWWLVVVIICQSPALAVQRYQRSFRCCLVTLRSCGVATRPAVDRDPKTRTRNAIAPACCRSVPFNMFKALVVLLNVLRAAITELPTHLAVVDQRNCGRDAPPKWNLPATTRLQQVGARSGMKIVYEPLLDGREATVVHAVLVSWQQTSSGHLQWSRWIGFQDRWCFSSVSFLCTRRPTACSVTTRTCGVTSCPWFRPLS